MTQIVFVDPPPDRRGTPSNGWIEIARQLRTRPGEWALCVADQTYPGAPGVRSGKITAFKPAGSFTARSVRKEKPNEKPTFDLYIKYLGEGADNGETTD